MKKENIKKLTLGSIFLIASLAIAYISVLYLYKIYPNLPTQPDFLFEHLPYLNVLFIADLVILIAIVSFIIFIIKKKKFKEIPFYATVVGIYYLTRSALIYATPMSNPYLGSSWFKIFPSGGMFPSGHIGLTFILFLFTLNNKSKNWNIYFIVLIIFEIASMLLSRGHYTIDIVGAIFIAYCIWKICDNYLKKKLVLK